jgi:hypothetical protein
MTIEIDPVETHQSDLDDSFRRHVFELLRQGVAPAATDVIASVCILGVILIMYVPRT